MDEILLVNYQFPNNREAIAKSREKRAKFVVASRRQTELIEDILQEIGTNNLTHEYSICYSAFVIIENKCLKILIIILILWYFKKIYIILKHKKSQSIFKKSL